MTDKKVLFQAGYYEFNKDAGLNFQLNRFYTYGVFSKEELMDIGGRIDSFGKWISLFTEIGERAEQERDLLKAATCFRAAQFYTLSGEKDREGRELKHVLYDRCMKLYNEYYEQISDKKND